MKIILPFLIIILLIPLSDANVDLHMDFYNSQDSMSMSLDGANLHFGALSQLNPDSMNYDNGGSSTQPQSEYSYSLTLNGETAYSNARTDSGSLAWSGKVEAGDDGRMLKVAAMSAVKDGKLDTNYGNNKFKVQEVVEAENSGYAQKALIQPDSIASAGAGSTLEPVPGLADNLLAQGDKQVTTNNLQTEETPTTGQSQSNPNSINYDNGGSSTQPQSEYSYSLTLNGETAYSNARTDSGSLAWSEKVEAGDDGRMLKVAAMSAVKDGNLDTNYGNNKFKVQEVVKAENSGYAQNALIQPDSIASVGAGSTLEPVPGLADNLLARSGKQVTTNNLQTGETPPTGQSQSNPTGNSNDPEATTNDRKDQGLIYSMNVQNAETGKQGSIKADVMGQTEAQWITQVGFAPDSCLFGAKVRGIAFAPISDLGMIGKATDFPTQILPPGKVEISYKNKDATGTTDPFDDYLKLVDSAYANFDSAYPSQTAPALYYYLNNMFQNKVPVEINYPTKTLLPLEQYNFGMGFNVRGK